MSGYDEITVSLLFTDIEDSTTRWLASRDRMRELVSRHDALLHACVESYGGRVFNKAGDGLCAAFPAPLAALRAAAEAQAKFCGVLDGSDRSDAFDSRLKVRMGIHVGAALVDGGGFAGASLSRAERICKLAHGGQILLSAASTSLVRDDLPPSLTLLDLGERRLRGFEDPERVFQLVGPDLPSDFPPLAAPVEVPNNLPGQITPFIGREHELDRLLAAIRRSRLVTLTGAGGCGKTRLSIQAASLCLGDYPDGVWFVGLETVADPHLVAAKVASSLRLPEPAGSSTMAALTEALRDSTTMIVLDNCEHVLGACAQLATELLARCPRLTMLCTSRERLGITGEMSWRVPSMTVPLDTSDTTPDDLAQYEATRLFIERAVAAHSGFRATAGNAHSIARVCRQLDGIPLAIELAAVRVASMTPAQIADRLTDRFRLLTGGSATALPRQKTLLATIEWSFDLLSADARALLERLSVFIGGCTLTGAESVCCDGDRDPDADGSRTPDGAVGRSPEADDVLSVLGHLVDKSLVVADDTGDREMRYRLLESIRAYALRKLDESGQADVVRARHAAYFLSHAEEADAHLSEEGQKEWLDRLEADIGNFRAALAWSVEPEMRLRMATALWQFWYYRGHPAEGRSWLEGALARCGTVEDTRRARALNGAGVLAHEQGDHDAARAMLDESVSIFRRLGDRQRTVTVLNNLGTVAPAQGDLEGGRRYFQESFTAYQELGDVSGMATSQTNLAGISLEMGDLDAAEQSYQDGLRLARKVGDDLTVCAILHNLSEVALKRGEYRDAARHLREALTKSWEVGHLGLLPPILRNLARIASESGDLERAAWLYGAGEAAASKFGRALRPASATELANRVETLRTALGDVRFAPAFSAGHAATTDQAVSTALDI